jgi:tRNA G26 N,N-dimethylase Trm1
MEDVTEKMGHVAMCVSCGRLYKLTEADVKKHLKNMDAEFACPCGNGWLNFVVPNWTHTLWGTPVAKALMEGREPDYYLIDTVSNSPTEIQQQIIDIVYELIPVNSYCSYCDCELDPTTLIYKDYDKDQWLKLAKAIEVVFGED